MTTLELLPLVEEMSTDDDDLGHWYCEDCYPEGDVAFCGADISGDELISDEQVDCPLCVTIDTCPKCDW